MLWYSVFFIYFFTLFSFSRAGWENTLVLDAFSSKPNTTMMVATLPLRLCFCKLGSIAEGTMKKQLLNAVDAKINKKVDTCYTSVSEALKYLKKTDLILLNKLYVNYSSEVDTSSLANSSKVFGVDVDYVGFNTPISALVFINNGIATATYRRVRDIVELKDISEQTKMMMITAAHLRATWETPFDVNQTRPRKFMHLHNRISEIPMMTQEEQYLIFENGMYKVIKKQLQSPGGASFTIIVPNKPEGLPELLYRMRTNPNLMKEARAAMTIQARKLVMPRLKIKNCLDLTGLFKNSTVKEILNSSSSDLNKILKEEYRSGNNMFISKIKQKLFLEVDELGLGRRDRKAVDYEPPVRLSSREVAADRPFFFSIDLEERVPTADRLIFVPHRLFSGVYYGPE